MLIWEDSPPHSEYLSNPATCSVLYRALMGRKRLLGPVLMHNDPAGSIRVFENITLLGSPVNKLGE